MERKFGVEIEFIGLKKLEANLATAHIGDEKDWNIISDASCGLEAVSPVLQGENGLEQIRKMCDALKFAGGKVNGDCGLHVHIDAADLSLQEIKNVLKYWIKFEDVFDAIQPKQRRKNTNGYCLSNLKAVATDADSHMELCIARFAEIDAATKLKDLRYRSRYFKLNLESFWKHGTIEFRHHHGTLNADAIINWVRLIQYIFKRASEVKTVKLPTKIAYKRESGYGIQRMDSLFITLRTTEDKNLTTFFRQKARKFAEMYGTDTKTR
jgi:hypothetical protein